MCQQTTRKRTDFKWRTDAGNTAHCVIKMSNDATQQLHCAIISHEGATPRCPHSLWLLLTCWFRNSSTRPFLNSSSS